jgi:hypothetical protein
VADPSTPQEPEPDEVAVLITRAVEYVKAGRLLPRATTWNELVAGIIVWLGQHWGDESGERPPCRYCGGNDWEYGPVVSFDADPRWPPPEGGSHGSYPYFQVGCRICGNTIFVNVLSVFEPQVPPKT